MTEMVFTVRLTRDDWERDLRAWRCAAVDLPGAFIKEARSPDGLSLGTDLFEIAKGPARVSWRGADPPAQIALGIGLSEELSPASEEQRWKKIAVIAPIISALIGGAATYFSRAPSHELSAYALQLRVEPNDIEAAGLPPARILINGQVSPQPVNFSVKSDVNAIVDVSKAIADAVNFKNSYTSQNAKIIKASSEFGALFKQLDELKTQVTGGICSGGPHGIPADSAGAMGSKTDAISAKLRSISADLIQAAK
jgi:hypothetical protein